MRDRIPAVFGSMTVIGLGLTGALVRRPWHDELYTLELARRPVRAILEALRFDSGPPGHYLLARVLDVAGLGGIVPVRLLSVLAVALAVGLLVETARRRWGRGAAWIAAALLALHPVVLLASVEARAYGLLFLAAAAVVTLLEGELDGRRAALLALILASACWVHSLGLVLTGAVLVAGFLRETGQRLRVWGACGVALVLQLPWLPVMLRQPAAALAWMERVLRHAGARFVLTPLAVASPSADLSPWLDVRCAFGVLWWVAPVMGAFAVAAGIGDARRRPLVLSWLAPAAVLLAASMLLRPVYFPGRGDVLWTGAAVSLLAVGLVRMRRGGVVVALLLAAAGAGGAVLTIGGWHAAPPGPAETLAGTLQRFVRPGDVVVTTAWWGLDVRWAMGETGRQLDWLTFPPSAGRHPGWYDDREADPSAARDLLRLLEPARARGTGIWLVRSPALPSDRMLDGPAAALGLVPRVVDPDGLWQVWGPAPGGTEPVPISFRLRRGWPSPSRRRGGRSWHGAGGRAGGRAARGTGPLRRGPSREPLRGGNG